MVVIGSEGGLHFASLPCCLANQPDCSVRVADILQVVVGKGTVDDDFASNAGSERGTAAGVGADDAKGLDKAGIFSGGGGAAGAYKQTSCGIGRIRGGQVV